jgi:hypothetical protein
MSTGDLTLIISDVKKRRENPPDPIGWKGS